MTAFSILIPTRNRLEYLVQAVQSVRDQDEDDWELCIADNASDDGTRQWVAELADTRICYQRSEVCRPVTDNWNLALSMSSGDHVVMLGDDDALLRGYLSAQRRLIEYFDGPDVIYSRGLLYSYPGVIPGRPEGSVQWCGSASFLDGVDRPMLMGRAERELAVREAFRFRMCYPFNMQLALVSRKLINALPGPFFDSPYPDYYAMNRLLLEAERIVKVPLPLVVVGATRKSFGYYYFNGAFGEGVEFLQNRSALAAVSSGADAQGSEHLQSWRLALEALASHLAGGAFVPDYARMRRMQFGNHLRQLRNLERSSPAPSSAFWGPLPERLAFRLLASLARVSIRLSPGKLRPLTCRVIGRLGAQLARETTWSPQPDLIRGLQSVHEVTAAIPSVDAAGATSRHRFLPAGTD